MNPFDLTVGPFLWLYLALYVVAALIAVAMRGAARVGGATSIAVSPLDIAWLAGGQARAADAAVVARVQCGAATLRADVAGIAPAEGGDVAPWLAPFRACLTRPVALSDIPMLLGPALDRLRDGLVARALIPSAEAAARIAWRSAVPLAVLAGFGVMRIVLGIDRGRPVGILAVLVGVTLIHMAILARRRPWRTPAGGAVIEDWQWRCQRLMRAPRDEELALAVALAGGAALLASPLEEYALWRGIRPHRGGTAESGYVADGGHPGAVHSGAGHSGGGHPGGSDAGGADGGGSGCGGCSS